MARPFALLLCTFILRILFICILIFALISYIFEFACDQDLSSPWLENWNKHVVSEPHLPLKGHRNDLRFMGLFLGLVLTTSLNIVGSFFESTLLLGLVLPLYLALVIVDFVFVGLPWAKLGFWSGYCTIIFGLLATVLGAIFILLVYKRGQATLVEVFDADEISQSSSSRSGSKSISESSSKTAKNKCQHKKKKKKRPSRPQQRGL